MSISTSITWKITNVDRELSDNFIVSANYEISGICTSSSNNKTYGPVSEEGKVVFNTTRTGSEIPYNNVTENNVVTWVKNSLSKTVSIGPVEDRVEGIEMELIEKEVTDHLQILYTKDSQESIESGTPW